MSTARKIPFTSLYVCVHEFAPQNLAISYHSVAATPAPLRAIPHHQIVSHLKYGHVGYLVFLSFNHENIIELTKDSLAYSHCSHCCKLRFSLDPVVISMVQLSKWHFLTPIFDVAFESSYS